MTALARDKYVTEELASLTELRAIFPEGKADHLNWCLASTSGIHGDSRTLDECAVEIAEDGHSYITLLVVQPRMVRTLYGQLHITGDDLPYLRALCASSVLAITASQGGNYPAT